MANSEGPVSKLRFPLSGLDQIVSRLFYVTFYSGNKLFFLFLCVCFCTINQYFNLIMILNTYLIIMSA